MHTAGRSSGTVTHLYRKTQRGKPPIALGSAAALACVAGSGIDGDVHANPLSPRQILITLHTELNALQIAPGALYENIVLSLSSPEHFRPGSALITSGGVDIRLTMFCEPCERIRSVAPDLKKMIGHRGVLGVIVKGGLIHHDDAIQVVPNKYTALPESVNQRFVDFIASVPRGRVVRYADIAIGMGVADSFVRALPGYIRRNKQLALPFHRIVNAQGKLLDVLPDQACQLAKEGVATGPANTVDLLLHRWRGE